jgi:hypothetical protein
VVSLPLRFSALVLGLALVLAQDPLLLNLQNLLYSLISVEQVGNSD